MEALAIFYYMLYKASFCDFPFKEQAIVQRRGQTQFLLNIPKININIDAIILSDTFLETVIMYSYCFLLFLLLRMRIM